MAINLADNNPRIVYSVAEGVTQTVFAVPFEFFEDADVKVYVDGIEKVEGTDYTLTGGEGATGTLTFVTAEPGETQQVTGATGGSTVVLFRRIAIERTSDFQVGQDINRTALNEQLDVLTALVADMNDRWDRAVHLEDFDTGQVNFVLPPKEQRIGNYFAFDADGDPVMTSGTTSTLIVSSFAETLLDDDTAVDMLATLGITAPVADINNITGVTASATELNVLDGVTGKTGADNVLVTGTAGSNGQLAQWNADGDVVGYTIPTQDTATWEAGTDTTESLVSAEKVKAAIDAFAPSVYRSSAISVANDNMYSFSHGLGVEPDIVQVYLECTSSNGGYSVGDIIQVAATSDPAGDTEGIGILITSSAVEVRIGYNGIATYIEKTDTFGGYSTFVVNAANWDMYVVAVRF
jgi:hypothetical protein